MNFITQDLEKTSEPHLAMTVLERRQVYGATCPVCGDNNWQAATLHKEDGAPVVRLYIRRCRSCLTEYPEDE